MVALVNETRSLPEGLAVHGTIHLPHGLIGKLIGRVFIEKSAVNLLTPVLDTPGGWRWAAAATTKTCVVNT